MQQTLGDLFSVPEGGSIFTYFCLFAQIAAHERLQQLVAVELADERAGVVVIRDIGGVLRQDIADDLVDGVIALFLQCPIDGRENLMDLCVLLRGNIEFPGKIVHTDTTFPEGSTTS